jgi:hypothetical protein
MQLLLDTTMELIECVKGNGEDDGERMERASSTGRQEEVKK